MIFQARGITRRLFGQQNTEGKTVERAVRDDHQVTRAVELRQPRSDNLFEQRIGLPGRIRSQIGRKYRPEHFDVSSQGLRAEIGSEQGGVTPARYPEPCLLPCYQIKD